MSQFWRILFSKGFRETLQDESFFQQELDYCAKTFLQSEVGTVEQGVYGLQPGRVKYQSSSWYAINLRNQQIAPGTLVRVLGISNITLIVEPLR